ncbi:MAG: hypothetical protein P8O78_08520 [Flavobacteriaceae bacterium]|nr:hypothetical protein [Flavobacteriaceae bacterium]
MNRIKLFDENVSPNQKRLRLMELSGITLSENQKKKLKPRTKSLSPEEDEIDLDEILKEMGYLDEDDLSKLTNSELKELIRVEVRNYFEDTFENSDELDFNEIIERLTN